MFRERAVLSQNSLTSCHDRDSNEKTEAAAAETSHGDRLAGGVANSSGTSTSEAISGGDCTSVFKDGRVEFCDSGDPVMSFDLGNGRQWKKRVWPRMEYSRKLLRWNSNEEILSYLISFERHQEWVTEEVPQRSPSGTILFFNKSKTKKYRNDGYDWKTRTTTSKTVREDRMKLKVGGCQLLYGCYAHSASDPNFHRRTYWLLQNPNLVMVHYLDAGDYLSASEIKAKLQQDVSLATLDPTLQPVAWSLMTISDCNLCALVEMTGDPDISKMLLAQLRNLLRSNFLPGSSLADILVRNNNGLPVDMYEDCRSKKLKAVPKKEGLCECECERARQVECVQHNDSDGAAMASSSCAAVVSTLATTQCNGAPILATSVTTPTGCGLASSTLPGAGPSSGHSQAALKNEGAESMVDPLSVLSKAPHLIMQYHNEGSVSYILTLPAANARGGGGGVVVNGGGGGGPRLLPRAPSTNGLVSTSLRQLQPSPIPSPSQPSFPLQKKNSKVKRAQDATNTQREGILDRLQKAISGLVRPRAGKTQGQASSEESHGNSVASMPVDAVIALDQRSKNNNMEGTRTDAGGDDGNFSMGGRLDPDLFQVPLSWLSSPGGMAAPTAEASMEDVLAHPSEVATALHSNQLQQQQQQGQVEAGLGDDEGVASGRREEVIGNGSCFMDAYNLDFDSSALDSMLGAMEGGGGASESQCAPGVEILSSMEPMESDQGSQESLSSQPGACSSTETGDLLAASVPLETTCPSVSPLPPSAVPLRNSDVSCSSASSSSVWENLWQGESPGCGPTVAGVGMAPSSLPSDGDSTYNAAAHLSELFTSQQQFHLHEHHSSPMETSHASYPNDTELPHELHNFIFEHSTPVTPILPNPGYLADATSSQSGSLPIPALPPPISLGHSSSPCSQQLYSTDISDCPHSTLHQYHQPNSAFKHSGSSVNFPSFQLPQQEPTRKTSNVSIYSEPLPTMDQGRFSPSTYDCPSTFHLSLPDLAMVGSSRLSSSYNTMQGSFPSPCNAAAASGDPQAAGGTGSPRLGCSGTGLLPVPSTPTAQSSISPSPLQGIPEGIQIRLENALGDNCVDLLKYRTTPSIPSSPSAASVSSSNVSIHDAFEDSPSVRELCEMLSESPNVQQTDFSHMTLTDMEQDQLFHAAEIIQNAFRKYKSRRQLRSKEKTAALLIENCYKKYREAEERRDRAARRIQNQYRIYKHRTRELDRAATFIEHMYRSKAARSSHPYHRSVPPPPSAEAD